jgi:hypothetical protein
MSHMFGNLVTFWAFVRRTLLGPGHFFFGAMKSALIAGIAFILLVAGLGAGYAAGNATSHTETTTSSRTGVHGLAYPLPRLYELLRVACLSSRVQRQGLLRRKRNGGIKELGHRHDLRCLVRQLDRILRESLLVGKRAPDLSATVGDFSA